MVAILWKCISRAGRKMRWLTSKNSKGSKVSETLRSKEGIWKTDRVCKIVIWWCWQIWSTHSVRMWRTANIESRSRCYRTHEETKSRSHIVSLLKNKSDWWKSIAVIPALLRGVQWRSESFCFPGVDTVLVVPLRLNIKKGCRPQRRKN